MVAIIRYSSQWPYGQEKFYQLKQLEKRAKLIIEPSAFGYFSSGSETEASMRQNLLGYENLFFVPRMLRDVTCIHMSTCILGQQLSMPLLIAPMAQQQLCGYEGELTMSAAAEAQGIGYVLSTMANYSLEEVARKRCSTDRLFFQLYCIKNKRAVKELLRLAECNCYKAIVVTVDAPVLGRRIIDEYNHFQYKSLPNLDCLSHILNADKGHEEHPSKHPQETAYIANQRLSFTLEECRNQLRFRNFDGRIEVEQAPRQPCRPASSPCPPPKKQQGGVLGNVKEGEDRMLGGSAMAQLFASQIDTGLNWEDICWIKKNTCLPVFVKGIMHEDDAELAIRHGVDGIMVSNHGGRQADFAISTIQALPSIANRVNGRIPVIVDGGITSGTDILKSLALGADAVMIGRPFLYALACGGGDFVQRAIDLLRTELQLSMRLNGISSISQASSVKIVDKCNQVVQHQGCRCHSAAKL